MAFSPGRNIGRVSIRVVPDTKNFNRDLKRQLLDTARNVKAKVKVEIEFDKTEFDRMLKKQLRELRDVVITVRPQLDKDFSKQLSDYKDIAVKIRPEVDARAAQKKALELREQVHRAIDGFRDISMNVEALIRDPEQFKRDVKHLVRQAEKNKVKIPVEVQDTIARAQLRYAARTRVVTFVARVAPGAYSKVASTLAALSGARIASGWLEDIADFAKDLDKSLPRILGWTTSITSAFGAIAASVAGVVGLGQGFVAMLPGLLVLPGLAINAVGSLIALFVAWKDAKNQLAPLADGMREIGEIINTTYWDRARQPILDLVTGLLPQMKNAFRELSAGVGDFTGAMATAFGSELGNGRFESIFGGIAEGWRILASGAGGFAGAIVSLSEIAAKYTPRLASWFVRQANTFDAWLTAIATDGRLTDWMEGAIDAMYDLWDATKGVSGVFAGLWRAAESAGSEGLSGFARLMQTWSTVVNSADFQRGLAAVFRGSFDAMTAFGDAIKEIGRLVGDLDGSFENFISSSGAFLGGLIEGIAEALNNAKFEAGLNEFSNGLRASLDGIRPAFAPIAETFGNLLGLMGEMARTLLPGAAQVIADLTPALDGIIAAVKPVLPDLAKALTDISAALAPAIADFVTAASPAFQSIVRELADALVDLAPAIAKLAGVLSDVVRGLNAWSENNKGFFEKLALDMTPDSDKWKVRLEQNADISQLRAPNGFILPKFDAKDQASVEAYASSITRVYKDKLAEGGPIAGQAFLDGLKNIDMPGPLMAQLQKAFGPDLDKELNARGRAGGGSVQRGFAEGMDQSTEASASVGRLRANIGTFAADSGMWLNPAGAEVMRGFRAGSEIEAPNVATFFASLGTPFGDAMAGAASWLTGRGSETMGGFRAGAGGRVVDTSNLFAGLGGVLQGSTSGASGWISGRGSEAMGGFRSGADGGLPGVRGVFGTLSGIVSGAVPNPFGLLFGAGNALMSGLLSGIRSGFAAVQNFVSGIAGWIAANKGPESYDRVLLEPAGKWIMGGLERGLESGFLRVQSRVSGMAGALRSDFAAGLGGEVAVGVGLSADAARAFATTAKSKGDPYSTDPMARTQGSKTFVLQGLTTRETAEQLAEEIDKKERRSIVRTGALPATEVL